MIATRERRRTEAAPWPPCINCEDNPHAAPAVVRPSVLELRHLRFAYPGQRPVLDDISFHLHEGDFVGLIGANGAGKSTLVRLILGLLEPLSGEIELFGAEQHGGLQGSRRLRRLRRSIGYVPQRPSDWNPAFPATCAEVVAASLYPEYGFLRWPGRQAKPRVAEALATVGLEGFEARRIGELSGGQLQRVHIARALVSRPRMLILDEPTAGIDEAAARGIEALLTRLSREEGLTILLVSHDIAVLESRTDRLLCLGMNGFFEHDAANPLSDEQIRHIYGEDVFVHRAFHDHNDHDDCCQPAAGGA